MNYRHIYHAGNFADVVKHAVLALVIERLKLKDTPFRVIDTHAGTGAYDLSSEEAQRTGEWIGGIGRIFGPSAMPLQAPVAELLEPYFSAIRALNPAGIVTRYPGSPRVARHLLRPQDVLVANELHPQDAAALRSEFRRDSQVKVMELDAWVALKALLPPKERRGAVLIDPPFEVPGEWGRMGTAMGEAARRFASGIYLIWYPIKDGDPVQQFSRTLVDAGFKKLLCCELTVRPRASQGLSGTGLLIANPPYELDRQLELLMPSLAGLLAVTGEGWNRVEWLAGGA